MFWLKSNTVSITGGSVVSQQRRFDSLARQSRINNVKVFSRDMSHRLLGFDGRHLSLQTHPRSFLLGQ